MEGGFPLQNSFEVKMEGAKSLGVGGDIIWMSCSVNQHELELGFLTPIETDLGRSSHGLHDHLGPIEQAVACLELGCQEVQHPGGHSLNSILNTPRDLCWKVKHEALMRGRGGKLLQLQFKKAAGEKKCQQEVTVLCLKGIN